MEYNKQVMNMELKSNIGKMVKEKGLMKKFVAGKLGISVHQLRNYEIGKSLIPIDKAFILCDLLGCKIEDLYERKAPPNK